jgi:flagellar motility protein MotE (MotC chaperone)
MTKLKRKWRRRGALQAVAFLLLASAVVRISVEVSPALANEAAILTEDIVVSDVGPSEAGTLLSALQAREAQLTARESQLESRMGALRIAEEEIALQLQALLRAESELSATIALADRAAETDLAQLTTVYENMKPKEAADLFTEMPPQFAAGFLGMMRPEAAALIMTELEPEIAYSFSVVLAGRNAMVPTE